MDGWIKLHRRTLENPVVFKDPDHLAVWIYLMLNATHKEQPALFGTNKITLKPGQLISGRKKISSDTKVNESKVSRILKLLKSDHQIEQQTNPFGSLFTILNWEKYQSSEQPNEQQVNNERTTSEQQVNTNKNVKNERMIRNKRNIIPPSLDQVTEYCQERGNKVDPQRFIDFYASKNWMIGKNKMKDWEAAVRNWERSEKNYSTGAQKKKDTFNDFEQRTYNYDDLLSQIQAADQKEG